MGDGVYTGQALALGGVYRASTGNGGVYRASAGTRGVVKGV